MNAGMSEGVSFTIDGLRDDRRYYLYWTMADDGEVEYKWAVDEEDGSIVGKPPPGWGAQAKD